MRPQSSTVFQQKLQLKGGPDLTAGVWLARVVWALESGAVAVDGVTGKDTFIDCDVVGTDTDVDGCRSTTVCIINEPTKGRPNRSVFTRRLCQNI